jgi:hypothetical protein
MGVSRAMRRMLNVLESQEEQCRVALESALGDQRRWETALAAAKERNSRGRRLVTASAGTGELVDRVAGVEEVRAARRQAAAVMPKIAEAEQIVAMRRREFLAKRIERRQAETLIQKTEAMEALEAARRSQRELDDWFLSRALGGREESREAPPAEMREK